MDNSGYADMTIFSNLPRHLLFGKILSKTPATATKLAIQLSFILFQQGSIEEDEVSSWTCVLDLDEFGGFPPHINDPHDQHDRFVKFLQGYLEYYRTKGYHRRMDTLKLNMRMNTREDYKILRRWLKLVFMEGVELKALDISCPLSDEPSGRGLSWVTAFANAKFLTSLKLDCVKLKPLRDIYKGTKGPGTIFPSLKTLSLKHVQLRNYDLSLLLLPWTCPSIEHLSLTNFRFEKDKTCELYTFYLKSFEFIFCEMPGDSIIKVQKKQCDITESFTWIGVLNQLPQSFEWKTVLRIARLSLTCLHLQHVKVVKIQNGNEWAFSLNDGPLFPNLKTMSFKDIQESDDEEESDDEDLLSILSGCPSLEYLSLIECCGMKCHVSSSSIKSLEIKYCNQLRLVQIDDAENLESFTFHSRPSPEPSCKKVILDNSFKLKNINICVDDDLVEFTLNGCQPVRSHLDLMDFLPRNCTFCTD